MAKDMGVTPAQAMDASVKGAQVCLFYLLFVIFHFNVWASFLFFIECLDNLWFFLVCPVFVGIMASVKGAQLCFCFSFASMLKRR